MAERLVVFCDCPVCTCGLSFDKYEGDTNRACPHCQLKCLKRRRADTPSLYAQVSADGKRLTWLEHVKNPLGVTMAAAIKQSIKGDQSAHYESMHARATYPPHPEHEINRNPRAE